LLLLIAGWICLAAAFSFFTWKVVRVGIDVRNGFWVYWLPNHFLGDLDNAYQQGNFALERAKFLARQQGRPWIDEPAPNPFAEPLSWRNFVSRWNRLRALGGQIKAGWVNTYDHLEQSVPSGEYDLDYPPLRLLTMTLWVRNVQAKYPGLTRFPNTPINLIDARTHHRLTPTSEIAAPLLRANLWADGISAIAMFVLVWIWTSRGPPTGRRGWRAGWGDPLLLAPLVLMGIFLLLYPRLSWQLQSARDTRARIFDLDQHVSDVGFWLWWIVRFLAVVCLARFLPAPFRAPACGLIAATLVWLNPALILEGFGFPQWDGWILPFFVIAAVLASINWWLSAGVVLGVGCMFKGQLLFLTPVLLLCPLFAGWPGRFLRIMAGWTAAAGIVLWPWLVTNGSARSFITSAVAAAAMMCVVSQFRRSVLEAWRRLRAPAGMRRGVRPLLWLILVLVAILTSAAMTLWVYGGSSDWLKAWTLLLCGAILIVPWLLPPRLIDAWLAAVFAASTWLCAFLLDGSFSWFYVGFAYGARKFQKMQLSDDSLSNLPGILARRFGWRLHDRVTTTLLPWLADPIDLDIRQVLAIFYFAALLLCAIGAGVQLRRRHPRFLIALTAPSILFVTLLTQMSVRYTILSAALSASMLGVSVGMSLMQFLLTVFSCMMLGTRLLHVSPNSAPVTFSIFDPTHPDLGYAMLLIAAVFLYGALAPGRRAARVGDL
jgi:hypothetical protein